MLHITNLSLDDYSDAQLAQVPLNIVLRASHSADGKKIERTDTFRFTDATNICRLDLRLEFHDSTLIRLSLYRAQKWSKDTLLGRAEVSGTDFDCDARHTTVTLFESWGTRFTALDIRYKIIDPPTTPQADYMQWPLTRLLRALPLRVPKKTSRAQLKLPTELWMYILDFLRGDPASLHAFALTCTAFFPIAQLALYTEVCLYTRDIFRRVEAAVYDPFIDHPFHLARTLRLRKKRKHPAFIYEALILLADNLSHVHDLFLRGISGDTEPLPDTIPDIVLPRLANVTSLEIYNSRSESYSDFCRLVSSFPNLRKLALIIVDFEMITDAPTTLHDIQLTHLNTEHLANSQSVVHPFEWLLHTPTARSLMSVAFNPYDIPISSWSPCFRITGPFLREIWLGRPMPINDRGLTSTLENVLRPINLGHASSATRNGIRVICENFASQSPP